MFEIYACGWAWPALSSGVTVKMRLSKGAGMSQQQKQWRKVSIKQTVNFCTRFHAGIATHQGWDDNCILLTGRMFVNLVSTPAVLDHSTVYEQYHILEETFPTECKTCNTYKVKYKNSSISLAGVCTGTVKYEWHIRNKWKKGWWNNQVCLSIVISLMGVQLCYFPGVSLHVLLVFTSRHTTFWRTHTHTHATLIIDLSNYSLTAYSIVHVSVLVSYTRV